MLQYKMYPAGELAVLRQLLLGFADVLPKMEGHYYRERLIQLINAYHSG